MGALSMMGALSNSTLSCSLGVHGSRKQISLIFITLE